MLGNCCLLQWWLVLYGLRELIALPVRTKHIWYKMILWWIPKVMIENKESWKNKFCFRKKSQVYICSFLKKSKIFWDVFEYFIFFFFVLLLYVPSQQLWSFRDGHLTTLFSWASLNKQLTSNRAHTFACNWQQPFMNDSAEGRRMTVEIISWSISTKVWDRAGIELATPGSTVSFTSVTRHVTDCATRPGSILSNWGVEAQHGNL